MLRSPRRQPESIHPPFAETIWKLTAAREEVRA